MRLYFNNQRIFMRITLSPSYTLDTTDALNYVQDTMKHLDAKAKPYVDNFFCKKNTFSFCNSPVYDDIVSKTASSGVAILGGGLIGSGVADILKPRPKFVRGVIKILAGSGVAGASTLQTDVKGYTAFISAYLTLTTLKLYTVLGNNAQNK